MKPSHDTARVHRSRRSILAAAAGAAAATAAASLGRPLSAAADDGDPLILGQANVAQTATSLQGDLGVTGTLESSSLVRATNTQFGPAIFAAAPNRAVEAASDEGTALLGTALGTVGSGGTGVHGHASEANGTGVRATNAQLETALLVLGKSRFSRSGRATVAAGTSFVDVDLRQKGGLRGTPLCFANLMSRRPGVFVETVRPNHPSAGRMRIYLNRAVTANSFVAWLVLN
jgi:hypothetical protein